MTNFTRQWQIWLKKTTKLPTEFSKNECFKNVDKLSTKVEILSRKGKINIKFWLKNKKFARFKNTSKFCSKIENLSQKWDINNKYCSKMANLYRKRPIWLKNS